MQMKIFRRLPSPMPDGLGSPQRNKGKGDRNVASIQRYGELEKKPQKRTSFFL